MIFLTGDVHQTPHRLSEDQPLSDRTEMECALDCARICAEHGVRYTLFTCGLAMAQEEAVARAALATEVVEFAGHTFDAKAGDTVAVRLYNKLSKTQLGWRARQRRDIARTLAAARDHLGCEITTWRSHAYQYDRNTHDLLREQGIVAVSSDVIPDVVRPYREGGLWRMPINTFPDHDHMVHGCYDLEVLAKQRLLRNRFGAGHAFMPADWASAVLEQSERALDAGGVAVILAHPICQYLADGYVTFRRLVKAIAGHPNAVFRDLPAIAEMTSAAR